MHTRSQSLGLASPPPSSPPPPPSIDQDNAVSPTHSQTIRQELATIIAVTESNGDSYSRNTVPSTPRKGSKRVRFSDPGPLVTDGSKKSSSSGLTPGLRRSTLSPKSVRSIEQKSQSRKRKLSVGFLHTPDSSPLARVEVQYFTPLKQSLDERTKRRLKRNHLSEETNDWEHEHREDIKARREASLLRDDCARKEEQIKSLTLELELQRHRGIHLDAQDEQSLETLRIELEDVKEKLAFQNEQRDSLPSSELDYDLLDFPDAANDDWDVEPLLSSPSIRPQRPGSSASTTAPPTKHKLEQGCQASIPDPMNEAQIAQLLEIIQSLERERTDARAAFAAVRDELQSLGFRTANDANADDFTNAIREGFRATRLELERILPGETEANPGNGKELLDSLLHHIKNLHHKSQASIKAADSHHQAEVALRRQFNAALVKLAELEESIAEIMQHRTELIAAAETKQQQIDALHEELRLRDIAANGAATRHGDLQATLEEHTITIDRLQGALKTYQDDARVLEALIAQLEADKESSSAALAETITATEERIYELEAQHRQAVADSEGRLAQLENDLIRAEEEVCVDRDKLRREKTAFEARTREMEGQRAELRGKLDVATEKVDELSKAKEELKAELERVKERFAGHGRRVGDILEELSKEYEKSWAVEAEVLGLA